MHPSSLLNDCYLEAANPVFQAVLSAVSSRLCMRDKWSKLAGPYSVLRCVL